MRKILLAGAAIVAIALASGANAAPLEINVLLNGTSITPTMMPVMYSSGLAATYSFDGGGFTVSGTASGDPFTTSPNLSSSSTSIKTGGNAGTITVLITDFNLPAFTGTVRSTMGINALNALSLTSSSVANYFDGSNTAFGTATQLATLAGITGDSTSNGSGVTSPVSYSSAFAETTVYTYTFAAGGVSDQVSGNSQIRNVPEPVSISLLGAGLVGLGLIRRRKA